MNKIYYEFLEKLISKSRKEKIDKVLSRRTRYIAVLLENIYQSHNLSAVIRTCDNLGIQDIYTIKSEKIKNSGKNVSLGAEKWVSIKSKDKDEKLFDYLNKIKKNGYKIVGTSTVKNNISCDITDLKFTIQYFSSPDYNKVREFYTNLINRRSQILSENDFYIFHIKSEIGDDYYLSYKNFETKKQAFNYCKKFLSDIDRCIIINFKN